MSDPPDEVNLRVRLAMPLSAANVIQAKTGSVTSATAPVALDVGTQAGSTVTVEIMAGGVPIMDGGAGGIPAGFDFDAYSDASGAHYLHAFHKTDVAAGEGVAGSTSWDFTYVVATSWMWRVTEWDAALDPIGPLEVTVSNFATGTTPTALSTGATSVTGRTDLVCLAWHHWFRNANTAESMTWSNHTNGFTVRDSLRWTAGAAEFAGSWSWLFDTSTGPFECVADINLTTRSVNDIYIGMLVVYAAATPIVIPGSTIMAS